MTIVDPADDIARLIALWEFLDYDTGGPVPPEWETEPDDLGVWAVWEGGPLAAGHEASARRCDRWWRENPAEPESDNRTESNRPRPAAAVDDQTDNPRKEPSL